MIEIGTRVQWTDRSGVGTVTQIKRRTFTVAWDDQPAIAVWEYGYYHLVDINGDGFYIEIIPSEPVTGTAESSYRDAAIERLAYNGGTMEYCLFAAWQSLSNALDSANADGDLRLKRIVGFVIESIERCAEQLKPKLMTDGTVETAWLAAQIYANRK